MISKRLSRSCIFRVFLIAIGMTWALPVQVQAQGDLPVILTVGESTTAGFGVPTAFSYPSQLEVMLSDRGYAYRVVNQGRSGITTSMALNGLDRGLRLGPKIVIIALGGNDRGNRVATERTRQNLQKMVSMFVRVGADVFLADRNLRADGAGTDLPSMFAELAAQEGAILMPSLRAGVAGRPELLLADGSHPNADGYTIVARRILGLIEPYLYGPEDAGPEDAGPDGAP
jgi:acyl-CoA thioesterase-1